MARPPARKSPTRVRTIFGTKLRTARRAAGLTQEALAEAAGVSRPYLSEIESGRQNITLEMAAALAKALGIELADLVPARRKKT